MVSMSSSKAEPPRILLVESDREQGAWLKHMLERVAYEVTDCRHISDLAHRCELSDVECRLAEFDVICCNARLLGDRVVEMLCRLQQRQRCPPLVMIDEAGDTNGEWRKRLQVALVIDKPLAARKHLAELRRIALSWSANRP